MELKINAIARDNIDMKGNQEQTTWRNEAHKKAKCSLYFISRFMLI